MSIEDKYKPETIIEITSSLFEGDKIKAEYYGRGAAGKGYLYGIRIRESMIGSTLVMLSKDQVRQFADALLAQLEEKGE